MGPRNGSALFAGSVLVLASLLVGGCSPFASKGTMPPPGLNGDVDASLAPDFIAVAGRDGGIAGYIPKRFLFPEPTTTTGLPVEPEWPVYGDDLRTLVGHMVAGKGFVPLGVDPLTVPKIPVQAGPSLAAPPGDPTSLTLYVRSAIGQTGWFAVRAGGGLVGGQGYNGGGVGCIDIEAGGRLVMLDRPPQDPGVQTLRTIYTRGGLATCRRFGSTSAQPGRSARVRVSLAGGRAIRNAAEGRGRRSRRTGSAPSGASGPSMRRSRHRWLMN